MAEKQKDDRKEKDETKKPDETVLEVDAEEESEIKSETKDTTKTTSRDEADAPVEEILAAEKDREKSERKIAWIAAGLCLFSMICLDLIACNDSITNPGAIIGAIIGVIAGVIIGLTVVGDITGGIIGGIIGGLIGGVYGGADIFGSLIGGIIGGLTGCAIDGVFGGILTKKRISTASLTLLSIVFLFPFGSILVPLSQHHNQNCLEKDEKIVTALKITVLKDHVEVRLPSEHIEENGYMKKVFSICWENELTTWKTATPCREGNKYWYKMKLPFPNWYLCKLAGNPFATMTEKEKERYKSNSHNIVLFFDHVWKDYKEIKEISFPDPNSL